MNLNLPPPRVRQRQITSTFIGFTPDDTDSDFPVAQKTHPGPKHILTLQSCSSTPSLPINSQSLPPRPESLDSVRRLALSESYSYLVLSDTLRVFRKQTSHRPPMMYLHLALMFETGGAGLTDIPERSPLSTHQMIAAPQWKSRHGRNIVVNTPKTLRTNSKQEQRGRQLAEA